MTRDQFRLPKLPFVFDFTVNENWQSAFEKCKKDDCFNQELSDIEEDLKTIVQSIGVVFKDCSTNSNEWDIYEDIESKIDYLKQCYNAYQNRNDRQLSELSPYFYKLSQLFKEYEKEQQSMSMDQCFSIDDLMEGLISSLNEIMLKTESEHEELHCSLDSLSIEERINSYLSHNVNHYDVILAKLFFNQKMICEEIENDQDYKELKHNMSKTIGLINDIYSYPSESKLFQQVEMNFIIKLIDWFPNLTISQAFQLAPDYVDELLQKFDQLSNRLLVTYKNSSKIKNYLNFWKSMYCAAILFCTQTPRYSKYFSHPIKYKFLEKFNIK